MSTINNLLALGERNITVALNLDDLLQFAHAIADELKMEKPEADNNEMLTVGQVCDMLHVTRTTLDRWDKQKYLTKVRVGGRPRYRRSDVEQLKKS